MDLADALVAPGPRDVSGSTAHGRFEYQLNWALLHLLDLHRAGQDYVMILDYHDDVLVLDSATDPQSVSCYQIKTKKSGNWTRRLLLKRASGSNGPKPSILGKLCRHLQDFESRVGEICFVSNARCSMKTNDGSSTKELNSLEFEALSCDDQDEIRSQIGAELNQEFSAEQLSALCYRRSLLSLDAYDEQSTGRLAQFLESIPDASKIPASAFCRVLKEELRRAQKHEGRPGSYDELITAKSTTRTKFQAMLDDAASRSQAPQSDGLLPSRFEAIQFLQDRLNSEGVPFEAVRRFQVAAVRFATRWTDQLDVEARDFLNATRQVVATASISESLWEAIEDVRASAAFRNRQILQKLDDSEARACIGVAINERFELPGSNPIDAEEGR